MPNDLDDYERAIKKLERELNAPDEPCFDDDPTTKEVAL